MRSDLGLEKVGDHSKQTSHATKILCTYAPAVSVCHVALLVIARESPLCSKAESKSVEM